MKKLFLPLLLIFGLGLGSVAHASNFKATAVTLKDTSNTEISTYALSTGVAVQTNEIRVNDNVGFASLLLTVDASGDVDVYAEYSFDKSNWYRPSISDMAGTATLEGNIVTAAANDTLWIVFTPRLAPWMRIVFDPDANSTITAKLVYQEDR